MRLRTGRLSDAKVLAEIHIAAWQDTYAGILPTDYLTTLNLLKRVRMWQYILSDDERARHVLIAAEGGDESDEIPIGFMSHGTAREAEFEDWREIYTLYIHPDHQGQGYGKTLMTHALDKIEVRGDMGAYLWVMAANPSRFFYEAMGGHLIAERSEDIAGQSHRMLGYGWAFIPD